MYRAIFRYQSDNPNALSFEKNDRFTISKDDNADKDWWLVENEQCYTGYVPANFLEKDKTQNGEAILYMDRGIAGLKEQGKKDKNGISEKDKEIIKKMETHKDALVQNKTTSVRRPRPPVPPIRTVSKEKTNKAPKAPLNSKSQPPPPPQRDEPPETFVQTARQESINSTTSVHKSDSSDKNSTKSTTSETNKTKDTKDISLKLDKQYDDPMVAVVTPEGYVSMSETRRRNTDVESDYDLPSRQSILLSRAASDNTPVTSGQRDSSASTSPGFKVYARESMTHHRQAPSPPVSVNQAYNRKPIDSTDKPELPLRRNSKPTSEHSDIQNKVIPSNEKTGNNKELASLLIAHDLHYNPPPTEGVYHRYPP